MQNRVAATLGIAVALCLLAGAEAVRGQSEGELTAKTRLFSGIGPGLRSVRIAPDGKTYVLTAPGSAVAVFGKDGKFLKNVPDYSGSTGPASAELRTIRFGESMDLDAHGTVYVADSAANAVKVWDPDGAARMSTVNSPVSVAALGEGEVAVATLRDPHLVIVFDRNGRDVREFGDPEQLTDRMDLNRFLNIGQLVSDTQGHLYYAFAYTPEPTVRQYDRFGYGAGQDIQYTALEAASEAQAVRREIISQEKHHKMPAFKRILTAVGIDRGRGEVWMALGNTLLHFDKDGNRRASYQLYTPEGARLEANTLLIEPDRLIIGSDPLGVYLFERPDKNAK